MNVRRSSLLSLPGAMLLVLISLPVDATTWSGRQIGRVFMPDDRDCIFFTLAGDPVLEPSVANTPWLAVPRSQNGFREIYAFLLWAKATGTSVDVYTSGIASDASCNTHGTIAGLAQILSSN